MEEIPNYRTAYQDTSPIVSEFVNLEEIAKKSEAAKLTKVQLIGIQQEIINFIDRVTSIIQEHV